MAAVLPRLASLVRWLARSSARITWVLFSGRSPVLDGHLYEAKVNELVEQIDWDAFVRNTDGTWITARRVRIAGPWGRTNLGTGQPIMADRAYAGLYLHALLERRAGSGLPGA